MLPWAGFLPDTGLGALLGVVLYVASRVLAGEEEAELARTFGDRWDRYATSVTIPWL